LGCYFPFTSFFNFRNHLTLRDLHAKIAFREGRFLVAVRYSGIEDRTTHRKSARIAGGKPVQMYRLSPRNLLILVKRAGTSVPAFLFERHRWNTKSRRLTKPSMWERGWAPVGIRVDKARAAMPFAQRPQSILQIGCGVRTRARRVPTPGDAWLAQDHLSDPDTLPVGLEPEREKHSELGVRYA
jgi:hypothetical protein